MTQLFPVAIVTSSSEQTVTDLHQRLNRFSWKGIHRIDSYKAACQHLQFQELFHAWLKYGETAKDVLTAEWDIQVGHLQQAATRTPLVVFAVPALWERPSWKKFIQSVSPIVFNIVLTPAEIYTVLSDRRTRHKAGANPSCNDFGIWDDGILTRRHGQRYVMVEKKAALPRIAQDIEDFEARLQYISPECRYNLPYSSLSLHPEVVGGIADRIRMHLQVMGGSHAPTTAIA